MLPALRSCALVFAAISVLTAAGCSCDGSARVRGPNPFLRCAVLDAPDEGEGTVGALSWKIAGRHGTVAGASEPARVAAFAGPAPSTDGRAFETSLGNLRAHPPAVIFVLGGIGDTDSTARATLDALRAIPSVTFVLGGGRDDVRVWARAFGDAGKGPGAVFDARGLRDVRVGEVTFVLASGAPDGRYAVGDHGCGLAAADADTMAKEAKTSAVTYLVSWAVPAGVATGIGGVAVGDPALAKLARAVSARGGFYTWPAEALSADAAYLAVGRVGALPTPRGEGGLGAKEPSVFQLTSAGIAPE